MAKRKGRSLQKAMIALMSLSALSHLSISYFMAVPCRLVARRLGHLHDETMIKVDKKLKLSLGIE
jgi:mRNA-degrading endonuclease toxin of MazEF toxin-antitoxin module